ncbi:hypothetical protein SPM77_19520, partial [Enterobacter hormaechei subsp. xiangfangensis]
MRHLSVSNVSWQIAVPNNRTALSAVFFTSHRILLQVNRLFLHHYHPVKEGANKRGNSSRLTQSFHFFMFEPIFSPVNAL